uniref:Uncharacterized protein n=1 Tax=Phaeomonas parva TaxID=124430 RepID=A0A7S1Y176_9STRA|mmetsp:Transcript_9331/g.27417  ORF Transcript_9331/g.27417 Transcript_9331/m.27417 type:complete len:135 (+) Transcript_9331:199-603(+)|eukprot:CAMPEP_0118857428 /NCGR_PEP_ID=MMETSP1163-20130328/4536_1 /TAXON_ID=124430 /ORGANISM="Phaeomonas parva, Strain CCMP2877" /LENGTH=134 /DNA_ID=CAMNT_0006790741 /DNA_START=118 /DNA_END=522 /DNA_ORIENTATION=+
MDASNFRTTLVVGAAFGLMQTFLTANVILTRRSSGITMGHGDSKLLERRIRGHANFCETAHMGLILIFLLDLSYTNKVVPASLAALLVAGRCVHALAFNDTKPWVFGRVGGMAMSLTSISLSAIALLVKAAGLN